MKPSLNVALRIYEGITTHADRFAPLVQSLGEIFGSALLIGPNDPLTGFDAAFLPLFPEAALPDLSKDPCPSIGIHPMSMGQDKPRYSYRKDVPLIGVVEFEDVSYQQSTRAVKLARSLHTIQNWRRLKIPIPDCSSVLGIEDEPGVAAAIRIVAGPKGFGASNVQIAPSLAEGRTMFGRFGVLIVDGSLPDAGYQDTDAFVTELLQGSAPPVIFRYSAKIDTVDQPGLGLIGKPSDSNEIQCRMRNIINWLGRPLA